MASQITLRHRGPSHSALPEIAAQAERDLGIRIEMQIDTAEHVVEQALTHPGSFDLYDMDHWSYNLLVPTGVLQGIPLGKYRWWDDTLPLFTRGAMEDGTPYSHQGTLPYAVQYLEKPDSTSFADGPTDTIAMVPHMMNADSLGFRPDLLTRPVTSWADILDPQLAGKTALVGIPDIGIMDAALAFEAAGRINYGNKGDMTCEEIDRTLDALVELKHAGHFYGFWSSFEESVDYAEAGVVLQSMWWPAIPMSLARGIPCEYAVLKEGYRGWAAGVGIMGHVDGAKLDAAYEYLNWLNSGWAGALYMREGYYSSVPRTARRSLTDEEWEYWHEGRAATRRIADRGGRTIGEPGELRSGGSFASRMGNIACWNTVMTENAYLVDRWNALEIA
jgi:putative spermidine/putrescine transport system substrate-binding protein